MHGVTSPSLKNGLYAVAIYTTPELAQQRISRIHTYISNSISHNPEPQVIDIIINIFYKRDPCEEYLIHTTLSYGLL